MRGELKPPFDEIHDAFDAYGRYKAATLGQHREVSTTNDHAEPANANRRRSNAATPDHRTPVLADMFPVSGWSKRVLVELRGFEPLTPSMRTVILRQSVSRDVGL